MMQEYTYSDYLSDDQDFQKVIKDHKVAYITKPTGTGATSYLLAQKNILPKNTLLPFYEVDKCTTISTYTHLKNFFSPISESLQDSQKVTFAVPKIRIHIFKSIRN